MYPAGWGDLVAEQAAHYGVDPLLMLALMRQESSFDPRAQSGAQAMGLTQIVPPTARGIASRLGRDDFALRDLFKPAVSVEFGTWFLAQLLGDYKGRIFPALAAYDAGGGNVARWLQRFGDDPDLLVEQIPFNETQSTCGSCTTTTGTTRRSTEFAQRRSAQAVLPGPVVASPSGRSIRPPTPS